MMISCDFSSKQKPFSEVQKTKKQDREMSPLSNASHDSIIIWSLQSPEKALGCAILEVEK